MSLSVNIQHGTNAGTRRPHTEGHAPTCACTRCELRTLAAELNELRELASELPPEQEEAGSLSAALISMSLAGQTVNWGIPGPWRTWSGTPSTHIRRPHHPNNA